MEWFLKGLKNYATFEGRARRKEYWMYTLFYVIFGVALMVIEQLTGILFLYAVYSLALLLPSLAISVRRLHDTGRSGWWVWIGLIPIIGSIILLVFLCQDSKENQNKFGENPKAISA
ncbi:DUF805 domain-containing protein [Neobacillus sp. K501]